MPDTTDERGTAESPEDSSALLSRLRVIEDQPLDRRASAFGHIHERLQSTLEGTGRDGGDLPNQHA